MSSSPTKETTPSSDLSQEKQSCPPCQPCEAVSRRTFFKLTLGLFALLWGAMAAYPLYRYLTSGANAMGGTEEVTSVSLGPLEDIPVNSGRNFQFGSKPALLVRDAAGDLHAYNAVCTHLGCTVQYGQEKDKIWCACHGGQFDPVTGKNLAGPPPKPLQALHVAVVNDDVVVSRGA